MLFFRTNTRPWCRRNYFINRKFQARFIMRFLGVVMLGSAMSGYLMYMMINKDAEEVFYTTHIKLSSTGQVLLPTVLKINFGVIALVLLAVAIITLFITHKVAGPLLRLGVSTEKIGSCDFTGDFRLRTNDELKELASSFEEMNCSLKERFDELKVHADEVDKAAEDLLLQHACPETSVCVGEAYSGREKLDTLILKARGVGDGLSKFKLEK